MNTRFLLLRFLAGVCAVAPLAMAQTATTLAGKTTNQFTRIEASSLEFDRDKGVALYKGNVRVQDPEMDLFCEEMLVRFGSPTNRVSATNAPPSKGSATNAPAKPLMGIGGRIDSIIALRSVVIVNKKDKSRATGQKAVYNAQTDVIELTGNPVLETEQGTLLGEIIEMDRRNNRLSAKKARMDIIQDPTKTNTPPAKSKSPATNEVKVPVPPAKGNTNAPPVPPKTLPKKKRDIQA